MAPQAAARRSAREQAMARQGQDPRTGRPSQGRRSNYTEPEDAAPPRGRGLRRALALIACLAALGAGGWYAFRDNEKLRQRAIRLVEQEAHVPAEEAKRRLETWGWHVRAAIEDRWPVS